MGNGSSKDHLGDSTLPEHVWAKAGGALAATERVERWKERAYAGLSQEERSAHYMELSGADHMRSVYDATHRKKGGSSGHYAALVGRLQHGRSGDEGKESKESKGGEEEKRSTGDRSPSSADHAGASHASKSIHLVDGHLTEQLSSKDAQLMTQVEKDIHRTAVALEKPSEDYDVRCAKLRRVLEAYCLHNRAIGYCQSMNFIAWALLEAVDGEEESSFWLLAVLCEHHFPSYWVPSMIGMQADMAVLDHLAEERLPGAFNALNSMGLPLRTASPQWLLSLLLGILPAVAGRHVLDVVLLEGRPALLACCLALLKMLEQELLESAQFGGDLADAMHMLTEHRGHQLMMLRWQPQTIAQFLSDALEQNQYILENAEQLEGLRAAQSRGLRSDAEVVAAKFIKRDAIANGLEESAFDRLYEAFVRVASEINDTPDLRTLNLAGFKKVMESTLPRWVEDDHEAALLFAAFDEDDNGHIDVTELLSGVRFLTPDCNAEDKMRFLFHVFDRNCSGLIDANELREMLRHMFRHLKVPVSESQLDAHVTLAMRSASRRRDSTSDSPRFRSPRTAAAESLDFSEFCEVLQTLPLLSQG